jgi:hypothetical protein
MVKATGMQTTTMGLGNMRKWDLNSRFSCRETPMEIRVPTLKQRGETSHPREALDQKRLLLLYKLEMLVDSVSTVQLLEVPTYLPHTPTAERICLWRMTDVLTTSI